MDSVLGILDGYILDDMYRAFQGDNALPRDNWVRQYIGSWLVLTVGGAFFYLVFAGLSWYFIFDKTLRKHPKFLKDQEKQEIGVALASIPLMAIPSAFIFLAEIRGYSRLYEGGFDTTQDFIFHALNVFAFLVFTDCLIYWIHRILHWPIFYGPIHKTHHRWIISTPFASHAFAPADGFLQSVPYHIYIFCFPMNKWLYISMFVFVNFWTVSIHDNVGVYEGAILNGAEHHTIHHRYFWYNYGQYFTLWDRLCGTHCLDIKTLDKRHGKDLKGL